MEMQQLAQGDDETGVPSPRELVSNGPLDGPIPMPKGGKFEACSAPATHCFGTAPAAPAARAAPAAPAAPNALFSRRIHSARTQPLALSSRSYSTLPRLHSTCR